MPTPHGRVEVPDIGAPQSLRVPQVSGDTYAPPPRPAVNNDMERLAQALSGFSSTISQFAHDPRAKKAQEDARLAEVNRFIASSTNDQLRTARANGTVPYNSDPVAVAATDAVLGQRAGQDFENRLLTQYGPQGGQSLLDANGNPVDVDAFVSTQAKAYLDNGGLPGTVHALEKFRVSTEGTVAKLREMQRVQMQEYAGKRDDGIVTAGFGNVLRDGTLSGLPPDQVAARLRTAYGELQQVTKRPFDRLDDNLVGVLKTSVSSEHGATPQSARNVLAILDAPRKSVDGGQDIGPLSANPRFANDVSMIRSEAMKVLAKDYETQQKAGLFNAARDALQRGDGSFDAVQDVYIENPYTGERKLISAKEQKDGAVVFQAQNTRQSVAKQFNGQPAGVVNGQVFAAQAEQFVPAGIENPEWKGFLKSSLVDVGSAASLTDPAKQRRALQAASLYEALRTRSPAYVEGMLDPKERDFYETFHLLRKMGKPDEVAMAGAARVLEPESAGGEQVKFEFQRVDEATKKLVRESDYSWYNPVGWFFDGKATNSGQVQSEIARRAKLLVRTQGISARDAITAVQTDISANVPVINRQIMFDRSPFLVKGKEPVFDRAFSDTFTQFKGALEAQGVTDPSGMSVRFENGVYRVIDATTGYPLFAGDGQPLRFTDKDLRALDKRMGVEKSEHILQNRMAPTPVVQAPAGGFLGVLSGGAAPAFTPFSINQDRTP
ncbi:hypothetical protein [Xanthobacter sp. YC-JY1]|uniref:hypothetical protein n=1 Tax=Xanthobacter sp. YC-JY1 TaxID=2419844 RepID=UPI001F41124D|nr:hypothetical protein [Xanthobacter sp. YC-JY1]UJX45753.1 hypothetical protein D7006_14260 [Xanthobacter sp. YC-JY1]